MSNLCILAIILTSLSPSSCFMEPTDIVQVQKLTFFAPFDNLPSMASDSVVIQQAVVQGDLLRLTIVYQGRCQWHEFTMYTMEGFFSTDPPQVDMFLSHDSHGDHCTDQVSRVLAFDLTLLRSEYCHNWIIRRCTGTVVLNILAPGGEHLVRPSLTYDF